MKLITVGIIAMIAVIVGAIIIAGNPNGQAGTEGGAAQNVRLVDGTQVIEIKAKGGYAPRVTTAQAGVATKIKISTRGTFDCSATVVIPSLGYRKNLPPSSTTTIDVPPQKAGTKLQGLCAMGMYNFTIQFN